ncbi:MAG: CRISPR-associated endonuclease Cas3'' [Magnetococcales bacterium]|nr:CRISPR-associated endonuclease Cas3'' [Magnetococcales bacterium]
MNDAVYAHIHKESMLREPLFSGEKNHLEWVASRSARFAEEMVPITNADLVTFARECGKLLGYWHDLGKCSSAFQHYLLTDVDAHALEQRGRVDHSTAGAQHAAGTVRGWGTLLAFAIAGHHAGLPDWNGIGDAVLKVRLHKQVESWQERAPKALLSADGLPPHIPLPVKGFACAFFVRMVFSCLTDADFLATEAFMNPDQSACREKQFPAMARLADHLRTCLEAKFPAVETAVQRRRQEVLRDCRQATGLPPGFFSLNVPTGGGKTLSSLAFALEHAARHDLRRVICAIPFTSIIEQNARVYREMFDALGEGIVLEHHANLDPADPQVMDTRLAAENWDAPIIVTTNVQFFETLFAHRPGRCRKLHRIARSVIVLDEAQALPVTLLKPCLAALRELVERYGCTVVLCTATQPALQQRENFKIGLTRVRDIITDATGLHAALKRVTVADMGEIFLETSSYQTGSNGAVDAPRSEIGKLSDLLSTQDGQEL